MCMVIKENVVIQKEICKLISQIMIKKINSNFEIQKRNIWRDEAKWTKYVLIRVIIKNVLILSCSISFFIDIWSSTKLRQYNNKNRCCLRDACVF